MGRPKDNPYVFLKAYAWWAHSGRPRAAAVSLWLQDNAPDEAPTDGTVRRWVNQFINLTDTVIELDEPFSWHQMETYGLPWEASRLLADITADGHPMTVRQARWAWRVHHLLDRPVTASEYPYRYLVDVLTIATAFAVRELYHHALLEPFAVGDLEGFLAYAPWRGDRERRYYEQALGMGLIPPLRAGEGLSDEKAAHLVEHSKVNEQQPFYGSVARHWWPDQDHPGLLPSEVIQAMVKNTKSELRSRKEADDGEATRE